MPLKQSPDFQSGVYLSKMPIDELKIRVTLEMVTTTALEEVNPKDAPKDTAKPSKTTTREQMDFTWQKRVYCRREVEFYKKESNCHTKSAQRHHENVKHILEENDGTAPQNCLYSCISDDDFTTEFDRELFVDDYRTVYTPLGAKMRNVQETCPMNFRRRQWEAFSGAAASANIVDYNPSKDTQLRNRLISTPSETMHILADLSQNDEKERGAFLYSPVNYQYVLVTLKWQPSTGTLIVLPDFQSDTANNGYSIKLSHDLMNIEYRYWVQNMSISFHTSLDQQLLTKKLLSLRPGSAATLINKAMSDLIFGVPDKSTLNSFVFIEFRTASRFDHDPIFILYFVDLPKGWVSMDSKALYGATHLCYAKNGVAVFSHLLELKLILDYALIDIDKTKSTEFTIPQPCLYLEVCNLDSWGRYRALGYAHTYICQRPGVHLVTLNTWRPAPSSIKEKLKYFFIGANKQLAHIAYSGTPRSLETSLLSKYGFETIASGDVTLKLNVVHQINDSILDSIGRKPRRVMDHMSSASLVNSVNEVIEAFHRARQRMLLAKTPLLEQHSGHSGSVDTLDSAPENSEGTESEAEVHEHRE